MSNWLISKHTIKHHRIQMDFDSLSSELDGYYSIHNIQLFVGKIFNPYMNMVNYIPWVDDKLLPQLFQSLQLPSSGHHTSVWSPVAQKQQMTGLICRANNTILTNSFWVYIGIIYAAYFNLPVCYQMQVETKYEELAQIQQDIRELTASELNSFNFARSKLVMPLVLTARC